MAYGNASKKTVPQSALSSDDLDYIAGHVKTAYGEKISGLEKDVDEIQKDIETIKESGGGSGGENVFSVNFAVIGYNVNCSKQHSEIISAISNGLQVIAFLNIGGKFVNKRSAIAYRTAKKRIAVEGVTPPMAADVEYATFVFFDGTTNTEIAYDPQDNVWRINDAKIPTVDDIIEALPNADTMSFPRKETVSEVSEE